jgi:hypothetical protein
MLPGDREPAFENGMVTMHPSSGGSQEVPHAFYDANGLGRTVRVKYLPADPTKFAFADRNADPPRRFWLPWILVGVALLVIGTVRRLWRAGAR